MGWPGQSPGTETTGCGLERKEAARETPTFAPCGMAFSQTQHTEQQVGNEKALQAGP